MRVETAARYLDATPWAIELLCRSGQIVAWKQSDKQRGAWMMDRLELDRYVERRHEDAAGARRG